MKDFSLLAEDVGARGPIVLPIPSNADPTEFPGSISAETGATLLLLRAAVFADDDSQEDIGISPEQYVRMENELLGGGAERLAELGVPPVIRQWIVSVLTVWHLLGREAGEAAWDAGPDGMAGGKASPPATSPKTGGRSSKGATSDSIRSRAQTSTPRAAGGSSARRATPRARRTG